jgi:tRNA(fMet)-specific endonuclease VapC
MQARFLLDTNICVYIRQHKPAKVLERFEKLVPGEAVLSVISYGELLYGAIKSVRRLERLVQLQEMTQLLPVLPLPEKAGEAYGEIRAELEAKGQRIGNNDIWIAAHAKAASLIVVTNSEKEFRRVSGLVVQNWTL